MLDGAHGDPSSPGSARSADSGSDWPRQAATFVEQTVGKVRDKSTVPAIKVARAVVFGTVAALCGITIAVLAAVGFVRFVDVYLPGNVWRAHLVVGIVFVLIGAVLWRLRTSREQ
jgi:hypothetical protein